MMDKATLSQKMEENDCLILGTWIDMCEYGPEMKYIVTLQNDQITVSAIDTRDIEDEEGEVCDTYWDGSRLHFTVYWQSSDHLAKCNFFLISPNQVSFTSMNTKKYLLVRKEFMDNMSFPKDTGYMHPILGTWVHAHEYCSDVEYLVTLQNHILVVSAVDAYDGKNGEIYDTHWNDEELYFAIYWQSNGRFAKCRFQLISSDQVLFTYRYTGECVLSRNS